MKENRQKITLALNFSVGELAEADGLVELPRSTLLTPGVYNGLTFTEEEIMKAVVPAVIPLTLNHSRNVEDEVGWFRDVTKELGRLKAVPIINLGTEKGPAALGYVKNRLAAGLAPNLSVELWATIDDVDGQRIARDIEIVKASLVDIGACSPADGCGVGLKKEEAVQLGTVPKHPWNYGKDATGRWRAPRLSDFTDKSWDALPAKEKRSIAGHYAWAPKNPPEKFTDLKLPHHDPSNHNVVWRGVVAAMAALAGARGGVQIPAGDVQRVYRHLAAHYKEFDKEPPKLRKAEDGMWVIEMTEEELKELEEVEQTEELRSEEAPQAEPPAEVEDEQEQEELQETPCDTAKIAILEAKLAEAEKEIQTLKAKVAEYEEKEKQALISELEEVAPGFDFSGRSIDELRVLVEFAKAIPSKPQAKRKTVIDVGDKPDPKAVLAEELDKRLKALKKEV